MIWDGQVQTWANHANLLLNFSHDLASPQFIVVTIKFVCSVPVVPDGGSGYHFLNDVLYFATPCCVAIDDNLLWLLGTHISLHIVMCTNSLHPSFNVLNVVVALGKLMWWIVMYKIVDQLDQWASRKSSTCLCTSPTRAHYQAKLVLVVQQGCYSALNTNNQVACTQFTRSCDF